MPNLPDLFGLYSEMAVALAGFAGVAAAFSGRERQFRPTERLRLESVLFNSASVLAGCFAFYCASVSGRDVQASVFAAAVCSLVAAIAIMLLQMPGSWRGVSDPDSSSSRPVLAVLVLLTMSVIASYATSVIQGGAVTPLVVGFSIQLLFVLWMFARLLTLPN